MKKVTILSVVLALAILLVACGTGGEADTGINRSETRPTTLQTTNPPSPLVIRDS